MDLADHLNITQQASAIMERKRNLSSGWKPKGKFQLEHWRDGKLIGVHDAPNGVTDEGKDKALDILFYTATKISTWYIGLIGNVSFTALADADTMASHAGWTEFTSYSQANRVTWVTDSPSGQQVANTTLAQFDITGSGTLKGVFIPSNNTKSGTTGTLWATALFAADIPVVNGDIIKITYTVTAS